MYVYTGLTYLLTGEYLKLYEKKFKSGQTCKNNCYLINICDFHKYAPKLILLKL